MKCFARAVAIFFVTLLLALTPLAASPTRILVLGDSLTEGYGISAAAAFPAVLEKNLSAKGHAVTIANGGLSGSTSAGAVSRLKWHLRQKPDILILALGANDGLRGISPAATQKNLSEVIAFAQAQHMQVLLAGMRLPPNYGKKYPDDFQKMFQTLARKYRVPLLGFLLEGVAAQPHLNLEDGIHPNEKGHQVIAKNLEPFIEKLLRK